MSSDGSTLPQLDPTALNFNPSHDAAPPATTSCTNCGRQIAGVYYEVNGQVVCSPCRGKLAALTNSEGKSGRLARAAAFGTVAAIAGAVGYYAFVSITGINLGLISILVGWGVGRAVFIGSGKRGGRGYQFMASGMTYLAIGVAFVAIMVGATRDEMAKLDRADRRAQVASAARGDSVASSNDGAAAVGDSVAAPAPTTAAKKPMKKRRGTGLGMVFGAVAMLVIFPAMLGAANPISLLILIFGVMQAWRMNRQVKIEVTGPYRLAAATPRPAEG